MTSETTTPAPAGSAREEWGRYWRFVKRPRLPERASGIGWAELAATLRMLALDLLAMLGLVLVAGAVLLLGVDLPESELVGMELTVLLVFAIVVVAPLSEEIAFRGWLSGRPGHLLAAPLLVLGVVAMGFLAAHSAGNGQGGQTLGPLAVLAACLALSGMALFLFRKHGAMRWFAWAFPLFYWLSTIAFALIHLFNYTEGSAVFLLPFVLPQLVTGSILGYVRVQYGLWASILLHALHNGAAVGAVLLALKLGT